MMKAFSGWAWLLMGFALGAVIFSFGLFHHWLPNTNEAAQVNAHADALELEAGKQNAANQRVEQAIADVQAMASKWQGVVAARTPANSLAGGGIDLSVTPYQLTVDSRKFRDRVQMAVNAQLRRGGVKVLTGPSIPTPTDNPAQIMAEFYNYPAVNYPVCVFELGSITVEGTYSQIKNHVTSWSTMPNYLAVTDGLTISGTAPVLTATYNLVVVAFIRGDKMPPLLPGQAPAAGAAPAVPGQPAGPAPATTPAPGRSPAPGGGSRDEN